MILATFLVGCLPTLKHGPLITVRATVLDHSDVQTTCDCSEGHIVEDGATILMLLHPPEVAGKQYRLSHRKKAPKESPWRQIGVTYEFQIRKVYLLKVWKGSDERGYTGHSDAVEGSLTILETTNKSIDGDS